MFPLRAALFLLLAGGGLSVGASAMLLAGDLGFPARFAMGRMSFAAGLLLLFSMALAPLFGLDGKKGREQDPYGFWRAVRAEVSYSLFQRYALAALGFLFFWLLASRAPGNGYPSALAWFQEGLVFLALVPASLAVLTWALSERMGRPLPQEGAARFGFWVWILFAGWAGVSRVASGPLPAWIGTAVITGTLFLLLAGIAWLVVLAGDGGRLGREPGGSFLLLAAWVFPVWVGLVWLTSFRALGSLLHGTLFDAALNDLVLLGLGTMTALGFLARPKSGSHRVAFGLLAGGLLFLVGGEAMGGVLQALALADGGIAFPALSSLVKPFLALALVGSVLIEAGLLVFFLGLRGKETS